jgi:hypothetical protein
LFVAGRIRYTPFPAPAARQKNTTTSEITPDAIR